MRPVLVLLLTVLLGGVLITDSAQAAKRAKTAAKPVPPIKSVAAKTAPAKPASAKAGAKPGAAATGAKATASAKRVRGVTRSRRRGAPRIRVVRAPRQGQPTKERYTEIQQALADKGYFMGTPSGDWNAESIEALKRFQDDQSLKASGKINSLSLIALGLGAKHNPPGVIPVMTAPVAGPQAPNPDEIGETGEEPEPLIPPASPGLAR